MYGLALRPDIGQVLAFRRLTAGLVPAECRPSTAQIRMSARYSPDIACASAIYRADVTYALALYWQYRSIGLHVNCIYMARLAQIYVQTELVSRTLITHSLFLTFLQGWYFLVEEKVNYSIKYSDFMLSSMSRIPGQSGLVPGFDTTRCISLKRDLKARETAG